MSKLLMVVEMEVEELRLTLHRLPAGTHKFYGCLWFRHALSFFAGWSEWV